MKKFVLIALLATPCFTTGQEINNFSPLTPGPSTQTFRFPCNMNIQVLGQEGDMLDHEVLNGSPDYTGFLSTNGNSRSGTLTIHHDLQQGSVSTHSLDFDTLSGSWQLTGTRYVDFSPVVSSMNPCDGGMTPWGTAIVSEANMTHGDLDGNGYEDMGWHIEIDPQTSSVIDHDGDGKGEKLWALGRIKHDNIAFCKDNVTAYFGADDIYDGYLYKFVAEFPRDLTNGKLYVLRMTSLGDTTGQWMPVPNTSRADRNNTITLSQQAAAFNFKRVGDVEVSDDGKVYFVSTITGNIYRFIDQGTHVSQFTHFAGGMNYNVPTANGHVLTTWGAGHDDLAIDHTGNIWVMQDGTPSNIWFIHKDHTQQAPDVRLFGVAPDGARPAGLTFSPDNHFMFLSLQHPSAGNSMQVTDITGRTFTYNKPTTLVIARREIFGPSLNASITTPARICTSDQPFTITATPAGGTFSGNGIDSFSFYPSMAGAGIHDIIYSYSDSTKCQLETSAQFIVEVCSSVAELNEGELTLYPNPSSGTFRIDCSPDDQISVFDACGRAVEFHKRAQHHIYIEQPGTYIIAAGNKFTRAVVIH